LILDCDLKNGEDWELVDESGNMFECSGVQVLDMRSDTETFVLRKSSVTVPKSFALHPAYPNPFNPVTKITFQLPEDLYVSVVVFNVKGQKVADLMQGQKMAGFYEVYWNGKNNLGETVVSGLYFYRMETEIFSKTMKLLFVK
jgi:hypothetical protein